MLLLMQFVFMLEETSRVSEQLRLSKQYLMPL